MGSSEGTGPPYVGALAHQLYRLARERVVQSIRDAGGTDVHETHLPVFSYPLPDGMRPADLARRLGMSRQAGNHAIQQLEALGYLERRPAPGGGTRRLVYLQPRGWRIAEAIWASMRALEAELAAEVGEERFATFMAVLREVTAARR
ncbi:winged helix-turn-helix transcriptional regulator [Roseomonas stagni]|uniref:Winged helix-turn-helix transcriptional regulator n=1 Tax=Falsiroseomonas algicola TaxID=2716930 RepID=A0A6M1LEN0_9PROT|nr:winged helix-turn-helix transcriptional regulator [Falsiroseomonas algicola]